MLQTEPSQKVKLLHCKLLAQALEAGEDSFEITNSSSYQVLSYLHADHMMKDCNTSQEYITLIKLLQEEKELYNFIRRGLKEIKLENYRKHLPGAFDAVISGVRDTDKGIVEADICGAT